MPHTLTDILTLRRLLATHGIHPDRSRGQNFLICPEVVTTTLTAAEKGPHVVTELGAGCGVLTLALLEQGFTVRAIEGDPSLAELLPGLVPDDHAARLTMITDDLRRATWEHDDTYQVVGNIPYNLSGMIMRQITHLDPRPTQVILLVQKEVGNRLAAEAPDLQLIGLAVQLWGEVRLLRNVPASCFWPAPKVDSQLVCLTPHDRYGVSLVAREKVLALAGRIFQQRRKQLGGTFRRLYALDEVQLAALFAEARIPEKARPQEVDPAGWIRLHRALGMVYSGH